MIEHYAIGVQAKLEDNVTPALLRIIDSLTKANDAMLEFSATSRAIGINLTRAAKGATLLGDSAGALTRASAVLDNMAVSSAAIARNLDAADVGGAGVGSGGGGGGGTSRRRMKTAGLVMGATVGYGLYVNSKILDTNLVAAGTLQLPPDHWLDAAEQMRRRELGWAQQYAFATHGDIQPFAQANLESSRLLRTLPMQQRLQMMDTVMPYAAVEAKYKGIELPEAVGAFIGLAHQAQAYSPEKATPLFESMLQASLTTHASLAQITRASSYAMPALVAAGANAPDVLSMLATMMQAGILNTKSGTWLNNMAMNALPNTLGSGLFKNKLQNQALEELGMYKGGKSQFYKDGHFNLMAEVGILAAARKRMSSEHFIAATRLGFGVQGQRAASLFSEPAVIANLTTLADLSKTSQAPVNVSRLMTQLSTVAKADQTIANATMTILNGTTGLTGPANSFLDFINKHLPRASEMSEFGVSYTSNVIAPPAANAGSGNPHVTVLIDGKDVAHHVVHSMDSTPATASARLNQQRSPMRPGLNGTPGL